MGIQWEVRSWKLEEGSQAVGELEDEDWRMETEVESL